jgi:ubiquitin-activating enzyme E1
MSELDTNLYSRQLYVFGKKEMEKITQNSGVILSGLDGLGTEIAKCLVLGGIQRLYIHDESQVQMKDLTNGYYYKEEDYLKQKSSIMISKLQELNSYVEIVLIESYSKLVELVESVELVIIANNENLSFDKIIELNNYVHNKKKKFIYCATFGLLGQIFCDFNKNFIINDLDGEEIKTGVIVKVEKKKDSTNLICETAVDHNFCRFDMISIKNLNENFSDTPIKFV